MSGICGVYYLDGMPAGRAILESMLLSIQHRGTDGTGIWSQGPVGVAHCTRWISREDRHERQPVLSSHADLVLVADARIDNRTDLIKSFSMMDRPASEISNGRLILKAYQTWGEACPEKLEGDYAFAIWDTRMQHIFCARDAAGVKPFYYYSSDQLFAFASEIKGLLTIPGLSRRLNERKLADYLLWSFEDTRDTFYQDIHRLPSASSLVIRQGEQRLRQYWSLDPHREIHRANELAYIEFFPGDIWRSCTLPCERRCQGWLNLERGSGFVVDCRHGAPTAGKQEFPSAGCLLGSLCTKWKCAIGGNR